MAVQSFSYDPNSSPIVEQAIVRERETGNFSAYNRQAIEFYEARKDGGAAIEQRLAAIENLLRNGTVVPIMPDRLPDENERQEEAFERMVEDLII